jgi:hypothetical protein
VVADAHDDPGHVTWGWKDSALGKRQWYYAKILRRKATMISLDIAPYFYALSDNYGSPEEDHIIAYQAGRLTLEAKQVYEAILDNGPLHTLDLRREARLTSKGSDSVFNRALEVLQAGFQNPAGGGGRGRGLALCLHLRPDGAALSRFAGKSPGDWRGRSAAKAAGTVLRLGGGGPVARCNPSVWLGQRVDSFAPSSVC